MLKTFAALGTREKAKNIVLYLIGVSLIPLGVVLTINSALGAGGYDALNFALAAALHLNITATIYATALVFLLVTAFIRKARPRVETFLSSIFLGFFTGLWKAALAGVYADSLPGRFAMLIGGTLVLAVCIACYMTSIFPTNPTDDFVVALHERGVPVFAAKLGFDIFCVVVAFALGGEIGVGTLLCTFCLGPLVDIFYKLLNRK